MVILALYFSKHIEYKLYFVVRYQYGISAQAYNFAFFMTDKNKMRQ